MHYASTQMTTPALPEDFQFGSMVVYICYDVSGSPQKSKITQAWGKDHVLDSEWD